VTIAAIVKRRQIGLLSLDIFHIALGSHITASMVSPESLETVETSQIMESLVSVESSASLEAEEASLGVHCTVSPTQWVTENDSNMRSGTE